MSYNHKTVSGVQFSSSTTAYFVSYQYTAMEVHCVEKELLRYITAADAFVSRSFPDGLGI